MKKYLDVMIDTETLSRRPNGAIIQIAAMPFHLDGSIVNDIGLPNQFIRDIDATSCAMYGMGFEQDTVEWWSKNAPANEYFKGYHDTIPIAEALDNLASILKEWQTKCMQYDDVIVWCQGTDFDIALLREAYRAVFGSEEKVPWKFRNVRDARTYFLEAVRIFAPDVEKPYDLIKTDGVKHTALADCAWSIKAVQWAYKKFTTEPLPTNGER